MKEVFEILKRVCEEFNISMDDLVSSRSQRFIKPRQYAIWLCVKDTKVSIKSLAEIFNRGESAITHSHRQYEKADNYNRKRRGLPPLYTARFYTAVKADKQVRPVDYGYIPGAIKKLDEMYDGRVY